MQIVNRFKFRLNIKADAFRTSICNLIKYYWGHSGHVRVFLSSTYYDLWAERRALATVLKTLPVQLFRMEDYTGTPIDTSGLSIHEVEDAYDKARNWSWKTVEQCDIVIFLTGQRYGRSGTSLLTVYSFVEMEFGWSRHYGHKKKVLPYKVNIPFPDNDLILNYDELEHIKFKDKKYNDGAFADFSYKLTFFRNKLENWHGLKEVNSATEFLSMIPDDVKKAAARVEKRWLLCRIILIALICTVVFLLCLL